MGLNKPVTMSAIANAINNSSRTLSTLCKASGINAYSPKKPIRHSANRELSEDEMGLQNYGFDTTYLMNQGVNNIFSYAKSYNWISQYLKPRGSSYNEWYRMLDFYGYEAGAVMPYNYNSIPKSVNVSSFPATYSLRFTRQTPSITISKMGVVYYNGGASSWRWAVAYRKSGSTGGSFAYGGYLSSTTGDVIIDISFPNSGTYECVFMACVGGDGNPMLWMPNGYFTISVVQLSTPVIVTLTSNHNPWISGYEIVGFSYMNFSMVAQSNSVPQSYGAVRLTFLCYNSSGDQRATFEVMDTEHLLSYSGTSTTSQMIDFLTGSSVNVLRYMDESEWEKISYIDVRLDIAGYSGNASWSTKNIYSWKIYK